MNKSQLILIGAASLIILGLILAFVFGRKTTTTTIEGELLVWGVFDDTDIFGEAIKSFNVVYPNVKITYQKKSVDSYESDLVNALAAGRGPDILYFHNTWLPKHIDKIQPIPKENMTASQFDATFVDVAREDFVSGGEIYALPLFVDTLALFYNKDIFNSVGIANPPSTWEGLLSMATLPSLTQKDTAGNITKSAVALGTAKNINRATDILGLLMLQSGTQMFNENQNVATFDGTVRVGDIEYPSGQKALEFYANFANPRKTVYTWNNQMAYSIDAFLEGKVAMMINYSYQIANLRNKSPHLKFGVSLMPQFRGSKQVVNYANYWGLAVAKTSENRDLAWIFAQHATQKDTIKNYLDLTDLPTARRDLIDEQRQESGELGIFAQQSLSAYSWYQPDNVAVDKIFAEMIESAILGTPLQSVISDAARKVNLTAKSR